MLAGLRRDPWLPVALAAVAFSVVFVVVPLLELFRQSLIGQECDCVGLENFQTFFESRYFRRALVNSLTVGAAGTLLALLLGVPLAIAFARYDFAGKRLLMVGVVMSMLSPPFIGAYAWIILFGRGGVVVQWAQQQWGVSLPTIYGPGGIALVSALGLYPVVFFVVTGALQRIDRTLEEAGASLGRPPAMVVLTVTLPLVLPGIASAALLVFLGIIADFGTANILGEGERYPVLATLAFILYLSEIGSEPGMAATTSVVLIALSFLLILLLRFAVGRRSVANDAAQAPQPRRLRGRGAAAAAGGAGVVVAVANLPLLVVVICSFLEVRGAVFQQAFSWGSYDKAFTLLGDALWNSLLYSIIALAVIVVAGSAIGYFIARRTGLVARTLDLLVMIPFVVPGTVLGIGYAAVFNGPPLPLTGTAAIIVLVYMVRRLPYMTRSASSIVYQIDRSLEEASANLGVPPLRGFARIMVPLMRPGIMAGLAIAWLEVFNELSASIVLYTGATRTLPIAAFQQAYSGDIGIAAAYATMLIGITAATLMLVMRLGGAGENVAVR